MTYEQIEQLEATADAAHELRHRIGDRAVTCDACPEKRTGYTLQIERISQRTMQISICMPPPMPGGAPIRLVIGHVQRGQLADALAGLNAILDAQRIAQQMDEADAEGMWASRDGSTVVHVVDVTTGQRPRLDSRP